MKMRRIHVIRTAALWRRLSTALAALVLIAMLLTPGAASAADTGGALGAVSSGYQVQINETIGSNGFIHPGVGLTKAILENMRAEVLAQKEPWYSYYQAMTVSASASKTITSSNQSSADPTKPATVAFNSQGVEAKFISDGLKAYTQALMYYITGDETYRANAMHMIRIWSQMDPAEYAYYTDAHIHSGIPLNRMVTAAEILRYTSYQSAADAWTDQDTGNFTTNLITPVIETFQHDNNYFMNQHTYPLLGAMAGYIFTDNRDRYNEAVEWFTVNKSALDQGYNGSIKQLFRLVDTNALTGEKLAQPTVEHVEMGRDQAHGGGDLTNASIIARMMMAQGTKVDPVAGTVSTNADAVGPYEFLDDRILTAANFFWHYMLGYDTPWVPVAYSIAPDGTTRDTYNQLATGYRGRFNTANFWGLYYYYTYVKGENVAEKAPYYYEAFTKRLPSNYYYNEGLTVNWDNVDGGGDFWLYIPKAAEAEGATYVPKPQASPSVIEIEDRYTAFDSSTATMQEGDTTFVRFNAAESGSKIALMNASTSKKTIGFRVRTNGAATMELSVGGNAAVTLPDTKGQWQYVTYTLGQFQAIGDLLYMNVKGSTGTIVDVDNLNVEAGAQLTPPAFQAGSSDLNVYAYVGAPVSIDLSATDSGSTDVVAYGSSNLPQGANLDAGTGAFSWRPTQAGTSSFTVSASDGTTVTAKNVHVVVSDDRASAVQAATAAYSPNAIYVSASLAHYQAVYNATTDQMSTASDANFYQQLQTLSSAAESLQLVTPLLKLDGSIDYPGLVASSTLGTGIGLLADGDNTTYTGFTRAPDLYQIVDFGLDYKVSATAFGFQSNIFADRIAGSAVFGSNDGTTWTRLTPGLTAFTQSFQTIQVDSAYQNAKYRYFKIQMLDPQPDIIHNTVQGIMELSEFRIYGQRYETDNQIAAVAIGSDQNLNGRIVIGDTVKLTIQAKEAIRNVKVKIQGLEAAVSTTDNINWTATAAMNQGIATGPITFSIDYERSDGTKGDTVFTTTDSSSLFLADESDLIRNVTGITHLIDSTSSSGRTAAQTLQQVNDLFDANPSTNSDFRLNGSGAGSYITFDFKEGNEVTLSSVELLARQDGYYTRISGAVVQGSNDNTTWTTLTKGAASTKEWQSLAVSGAASYRYIRIYNSGSWYGNMAEVRFHGAVNNLSRIASASISSAQSIDRRIVPGNTVQVAFVSTEAINNVHVTVQGQEAAVSSTDLINWTAVATLGQGAATGPVVFAIHYDQQDGSAGFPITTSSDNSALFLVDESDLIRNVTDVANLLDSTSGRSAATTLQQVNALFDGNTGTNSDFRIGGNNSGSGSYMTFDFKDGNQAALSSVELLARQDNNLYTRIAGTVVQGSNDNTMWTALTTAAASTPDWQTFAISSKVPYRYIRVYNPKAWYGNMAELRLHGAVKPADVTPPVTTDDAPQGWLRSDALVTFTATDAETGVAATYFTVDGGMQQTGSTVALSNEGAHTLSYWSIDWAGNVEQTHTVSVNIDKTAPTITVSGLVYGSYGDSMEITPNVALSDALSGVDDSKTTVTLSTYGTQQPVQSGAALALYKLPLGSHRLIVTASDLAGNTASQTVVFQTAASIDSMKVLVTRFATAGWIDNAGIAGSLQSKLKANALAALANEVKAQRGKHISSQAADYLLRDTEYLLTEQ